MDGSPLLVLQVVGTRSGELLVLSTRQPREFRTKETELEASWKMPVLLVSDLRSEQPWQPRQAKDKLTPFRTAFSPMSLAYPVYSACYFFFFSFFIFF